MDKYEILKQYFGYDSFREGQEALIDSLLAGRDVLGVIESNGGRQVPLLSDSRSAHEWHHSCNLAPDLSDEGSGELPTRPAFMPPI